jgi:hypothetical protein
MQVNVTILETTLQQWGDLQGKTLDPAADPFGAIDANNLLDLADFEDQKLVMKYYPPGTGTSPLCTVVMNNLRINAFGERQQVQGRGERTLGFIGSNITITGADG